MKSNLDNLKAKMTEKFDEFWNTGDNWMNQQKVEHFISEQIEEAFKAGQREMIEEVISRIDNVFKRSAMKSEESVWVGFDLLLESIDNLKSELAEERKCMCAERLEECLSCANAMHDDHCSELAKGEK